MNINFNRNEYSEDHNRWTFKRIIALVGVALLVGMYIALLIFAFIFPEGARQLFLTAVAATIAIPILIWIITWSVGVMTGRRNIASMDVRGADPEDEEFTPIAPSAPESQINTVIFDVGNVLVDFCWEDMFRNKGVPADKIKRLAKATVQSKDWNEFDIGKLSTGDILNRFIDNDLGLEAEIRRSLSNLEGIVRLKPDSIQLIRALKRAHYRVLILSNFSKQARDDNPDEMVFLEEVDGGILSYEEHVIKPDVAIYEKLIAKYELNPDQCVFMDDVEANVEAAWKVGIHAFQYKNRKQMVEELRKLGVK